MSSGISAYIIEPAQPGAPPDRRDAAVRFLEELTEEVSGGVWDKPLPWGPLRAAMLEAGFLKDTIRRAARTMGIRFNPSRGKRMQAYPPGFEETPVESEPEPPHIHPESRPAPQQAETLIGLAPIPRSAASRLVELGVRTVGDALALDLDTAIGAVSADRLREFADSK